MKAEDLVAAIATAKTSATVRALLPRFDMRRQAIKARVAEIAMPASRLVEPPPTRAAALRSGPAAVVALDAEEQLLSAEALILDRGEFAATARLRELEAVEALAALPAARKRLPSRIDAVREALARLDEALEQLDGDVSAVASGLEHAERFDIEDEELEALLLLREDCWKPRRWPVIRPPLDRKFPKSVALFYDGRLPIFGQRASAADSRCDVTLVTDDPTPQPARPRPVRRLLERLGRT